MLWKILSALDVLECVRLHPGAHVTLTTYNSGVSPDLTGNELVGLVPSSMLAGARSAMAILWPLLAYWADQWSGYFIDEWMRSESQKEGHALDLARDHGLVNLACMTQRANLRLMERVGWEQIKDWCGFVFYG